MNSTYRWPEGERIVYLRPPKEDYLGKLGYFYDPALFPELKPLTDNWEAMRDEILNYERSQGSLREMDSHDPPDNTENQWSHTYLMNYRWLFKKNMRRFPVISGVIAKIPNAVYATISILPPETDILPHCGNTNAIVRAHIGLIIPEPAPVCAIQVGSDTFGWQEGKLLTFTIVNRHSAWNRSKKRRYIIIVDIIPEHLRDRTLEICSKNLGVSTFTALYNRFSAVRHLPDSIHEMTCTVFGLLWRAYLPLQSRIKFL